MHFAWPRVLEMLATETFVKTLETLKYNSTIKTCLLSPKA